MAKRNGEGASEEAMETREKGGAGETAKHERAESPTKEAAEEKMGGPVTTGPRPGPHVASKAPGHSVGDSTCPICFKGVSDMVAHAASAHRATGPGG